MTITNMQRVLVHAEKKPYAIVNHHPCEEQDVCGDSYTETKQAVCRIGTNMQENEMLNA